MANPPPHSTVHVVYVWPPSDIVQPLSRDKSLLTSGQLGLAFPMKKLTEYFDYEEYDYKYQDYIEFQLQISCKKVDKYSEDSEVNGLAPGSPCKFKFKSENCYTCR